jgi:hypothetical protein
MAERARLSLNRDLHAISLIANIYSLSALTKLNLILATILSILI